MSEFDDVYTRAQWEYDNQEPPEGDVEGCCDLCGAAVLTGDIVYVIHGKPVCRACIANSREVVGRGA